MGLGKLPATQTNAIEQPSPPNYWLSTEELKNRGASQTAAEMGQGRELSIAGKTETGKIAFSVVLPEPMSAVRHVSSRGQGVLTCERIERAAAASADAT
jgi:hypothetical protein